MESSEVRKKFLEFFQKNQHEVMSGSDLIINDPSLLFVNAGMNQFKDVFLGLKPPPKKRDKPAKNVVTIQKCLRVGGKHNDLEEVGATPLHHTFFEMLGNFSFGGYFKEEAIRLAWKFLTQELKIPSEHLWVTVHHEDEESYKIWKDQEKVPSSKIYRLGDKDNFWQMGETGPCGYCSEIHYYKGKNKSPDPSQFMEIWNLVFMEFKQQKDGRRAKLPLPCVDTGMGLERLCAVLQNKKSNYHTDLFVGVIQELEKYCDFQYIFSEKPTDNRQPEIKQSKKIQTEGIQLTVKQKAFRVVADHSRAISLLIAETVRPGNQKEDYVLRRIIRRALYYSQKLQPKTNLLKEKSLLEVGAEKAIALMEEANKNLGKNFKEYERHFYFPKANKDLVRDDIHREDDRFSNSLKEGEKRLEEIIQTLNPKNYLLQKDKNKGKRLKLDKQTVWNLYSTYGFPMDLTRLIAKERGWDAPTEEEMEKYTNELSQKVESFLGNKEMKENKEEGLQFIYDNLSKEERLTEWTAYKNNEESVTILQTCYVQKQSKRDGRFLNISGWGFSKNPIPKGLEGWIVMDQTCFYPEGGGPIGDKGWIETDTGKALVLDCRKYMTMIAHKVKVSKGELSAGQLAKITVDKNFREGIKSHHTATHLLNSALRKVLGTHVKQAGSLVEPCFLRFDFTHHQALSQKQIQEIEGAVLTVINKFEPVQAFYKTFKKAQEEEYLYLKGENYPEEVRVLKIGEDSSKELCGGIHVQNTKDIKSFKIIREEGVGSGIRRITAYTNKSLISFEDFLVQQNLSLRGFLNSSSAKKEESKKKENVDRKGLEIRSFEKMKSGNIFLWKGSIEQTNPFLKVLEQIEAEIKKTKQAIIKWKDEEIKTPSLLGDFKKQKKTKQFHPLAEQMLELRGALNLTPPQFKEKFSQTPEFLEEDRAVPNLPIEFFKKKLTELEELKKQKESLKKENLPKESIEKQAVQKEKISLDELKKQVKYFSINKDINSKKLIISNENTDSDKAYLVVSVPLEDRKILSDMSDFLLSKLELSALILVGKSQEKHPVFLNFNKELSSILSAGDILKKNLAPLCDGKGGGKAGFAQGSIKDREKLLKLTADLIFNMPS